MKTYGYFLLCFLLTQIAYATDFYCDPVNGSTSNDGSKGNPWGSLESVFAKGIEFKAGDAIFLLSGNHGDVKVIGQNEKYITISGLAGQHPTISSIIFGTDELPASKWIFSNITFNGSLNSNTVFIRQNSSKIRLTENNFISNAKDDTAIDVKGSQCKIESNVITNYKNGIIVSGEKTQIRNNRIDFFSHNAITISGNYNLLEYNLVKESIATDSEINSGIYFTEKETKGNIFRGNTIINFTKANRAQIGVLNGIYGLKTIISESIFENNIVVTNGEKGISLNGQLNNLKIVNNTVVNPYFGLNFNEKDNPNTALAIQVIGENDSSNLFIRNNLSNDVLFENIKGIADYNLTLPVSVHDYDKCFNNWALFDFSLGPNSKALNSGTPDMAPNLDASQNKRSLGNFVNVGAFEYTKIDEANQVFEIASEASDRQIHSKGKGDWDGQPQIRIGGVGENIDGAGIFPFKLPEIPGGKKILSANFKVYLSKIDNQPEGGIDLYALPPKSNFWVTEDLYYQGTFGQDVSARPIQNNFVDSNMYSGEIKTNNIGQKGLKDYLNTIFETETNASGYIFLRMNPNSKDVSDYNRWNFVSANGKKKENQPTLEITVGYPELNEGTASNIESIKNHIIIAPNPTRNGEFNVYFLGFSQDKMVPLKLLNFSGEQVFEQTVNLSDVSDHIFRSENSQLPTGKYLLEYTIDGVTNKQIFFVW